MLNPKHIKEFENHLLANNKSKETIQSYMRTIKQFLNLINKIPEQIVKDDIEKYKYWTIEIKHYDRNSLTPKYCAIKTFLEFLDLPEKEIKSFKLNPPQIEVKPKIPLTRQEV
jgi:site-specific recombinase XerD